MNLFKTILESINNFIKNLGDVSDFFKDDKTKTFSMGRLVTFMVIFTLCFDAYWTLIVLRVVWDFTTTKLLFGVVAIGGKVSEKLITNWDIGSIGGLLSKNKPTAKVTTEVTTEDDKSKTSPSIQN
jgi:hypothetical protein